VTKYRRKVFTSKSLALIEKSFREVAEKSNFQVLEFNGESDHVHALIEYPPKLSISVMVNSLKGVSSRRYGQAGYPKPYGKDALWSPSYFVSSVGGATLEGSGSSLPFMLNQQTRCQDNILLTQKFRKFLKP
jgi:putative transposase